MDPWGEGPGEITRDACAVDVYARLPPAGEPKLVHDRIPPGANILDLGCGTGRLAEPLSELGHAVTGVDDSPAMLAHLEHEGDLLTATVTYVVHGNSWSHHFTTRRLTIEDLERALLGAGLHLHDRFRPGGSWVEARGASSP